MDETDEIDEIDEVDEIDETDGMYVYITPDKKEKKRGELYIHIIQITVVVLLVAMLCAAWFYPTHTNFYLAYLLAHLGHADAQHVVGQRYMLGMGVRRNTSLAMQWFRRASNQGHTQSCYNLAVGHLQGYRSGIKNEEAKRLLKHAVDQGMNMAKDAWEKVYNK